MTVWTSVGSFAEALQRAESDRRQVPPLTADGPVTIDDAYAVQLANVARRVASGERIVGKKVGLTAKAMQRMLGVESPDYGHLFEAMQVPDGGSMPASELMQPRVEAEIAVILARPLRGPGLTDLDVLAALEAIVPAIEIIDTRITDWKITLADTIADNGSSARFVLGAKRSGPLGIDLRTAGMVLEKNGETVGTGAGAAVLGAQPLRAVAWLANTLAAFGVTLEAGEIVLPGALSAAVPVAAGDTVRADFGILGSATVRFT